MEAAEVAFGSSFDDSDWERERVSPPAARAHVAFDGERPVAPRGRVRVRPDRPGWPASLCGRHLGRRPPDAPAPRDPAPADGSNGARRHPRLGRARSRRSGPRSRPSTAASATASPRPGVRIEAESPRIGAARRPRPHRRAGGSSRPTRRHVLACARPSTRACDASDPACSPAPSTGGAPTASPTRTSRAPRSQPAASTPCSRIGGAP